MSPERQITRGSRVKTIAQKLKEQQNYERPKPRSYTLQHRRTYSTNDLRERRDRFERERKERRAQDSVIDDLKGRRERTAHDKVTELPKRTISHVVTRLVARSLLIGFWWLLVLLWSVLTFLPRTVVFVFVKDKRKHREEVPADKASKKYKVADEPKVRRVRYKQVVMVVVKH